MENLNKNQIVDSVCLWHQAVLVQTGQGTGELSTVRYRCVEGDNALVSVTVTPVVVVSPQYQAIR